MKKRYRITEEAPLTAAVFERQPYPADKGEYELELSYREEQAMVAAGWIELLDADEEKGSSSKGGKS